MNLISKVSPPYSLSRRLLAGIISLCCLLFMLAFVHQAKAGEFTLGAGASVSSSPYKEYGHIWSPFPMISYEGDFLYIRGMNAGFKVINLPYLEFSAFAGYDDTSFRDGDSTDNHLRKLDNRASSAIVGLEMRLTSPYGMLHASVARDALGISNGFKGDIGYILSLEFGPLEILPAAGVSWNNDKYNDYYYGITHKQARKSELDAYKPGGGFSPYLSFGIDYSITEQWEFFCQGKVNFLSPAIKESPMVGTSHTQSLTTGITYTF